MYQLMMIRRRKKAAESIRVAGDGSLEEEEQFLLALFGLHGTPCPGVARTAGVDDAMAKLGRSKSTRGEKMADAGAL
jgi:hypothetical protein